MLNLHFLQIQIVCKLLGKTSVFNCGEILQCSLQESTSFECKWPEGDLHVPSKQKVGKCNLIHVLNMPHH